MNIKSQDLHFCEHSLGGSWIFDWGGPRIDKAQDAGQNVAIFALKSWPIGGGHGPVAPPGSALVHASVYS